MTVITLLQSTFINIKYQKGSYVPAVLHCLHRIVLSNIADVCSPVTASPDNEQFYYSWSIIPACICKERMTMKEYFFIIFLNIFRQPMHLMNIYTQHCIGIYFFYYYYLYFTAVTLYAFFYFLSILKLFLRSSQYFVVTHCSLYLLGMWKEALFS